MHDNLNTPQPEDQTDKIIVADSNNNIVQDNFNYKKYLQFHIIATFINCFIIAICLSCTTFSFILHNVNNLKVHFLPLYLSLLIASLVFYLLIVLIYFINYRKLITLNNSVYNRNFIYYAIRDGYFYILILGCCLISYVLFQNSSYLHAWIFVIMMLIQLILSIIFIIKNIHFLMQFMKIFNKEFIYKDNNTINNFSDVSKK